MTYPFRTGSPDAEPLPPQVAEINRREAAAMTYGHPNLASTFGMTFDRLSIGDAFLDLNGEWHRKVPTSIGQNAVTADGVACIFSPNYPVRPVGGDS